MIAASATSRLLPAGARDGFYLVWPTIGIFRPSPLWPIPLYSEHGQFVVGLVEESMTLIPDKLIDGASDANLLAAFTKTCEQHGFSSDGEDGSDLATVLSHAFERGITSEAALIALVENLING